MTTNPDYSPWPRFPGGDDNDFGRKVRLGDKFLGTPEPGACPRTITRVFYDRHGWHLEDEHGWSTSLDRCRPVPAKVTLTITDVDPDEYARQIRSLEHHEERVAARNYLEALFLRASVEKQS